MSFRLSLLVLSFCLLANLRPVWLGKIQLEKSNHTHSTKQPGVKRSELADCNYTIYGCCPDGQTPADSSNLENCPRIPDQDENSRAACENTEFGCCMDNKTPARGPYKEGCIDYSCKHSEFGCCEDLVTPAKNSDFKDCPTNCYQSLYGCCPDGRQASRGLAYAGCDNVNYVPCAQSEFGCCEDGYTLAHSPAKENCAENRNYDFDTNRNTDEEEEEEEDDNGDDNISLPPELPPHHVAEPVNVVKKVSSYSSDSGSGVNCADTPYECCPDGVTPATGPEFQGCKDATNYQAYRTISSQNFDSCTLPEPSRSCDNYTLQWRFNMDEGRCVQFWYGGCNGNENQFNTQIDCENRCVKPNGTEICKLPLINPTGQCQQNVTRYYYDIKNSVCKKFSYSGCFGNANNFETLEECERRCQVQLLFEQCSYLPDKGPCHGEHERWYFDSKSSKCKSFTYGGCLKNSNNHLSENACVDSCVKPKQRAVCFLPKIVGNCDQAVYSWYYDFADGKCKRFTYSGCNGNLNRFETFEACQYTCQGLSTPEKKAEIVREVCEAPKVTGICHLQLQRYYYNSTTMMCHQFSYSGCDGTANNFETESDCRTSCNAKEVDPCVLPLDYGTCDQYKIYWYFNQVDRECVRFYYGGCDGNQNRFESRESCEMQCKLSPEERQALLRLPKQCIMPMEYGTGCEAGSTKWYFDTSTKICYPFEYTGCGPQQSNRFEDQQDCERNCVESSGDRPRPEITSQESRPHEDEVTEDPPEADLDPESTTEPSAVPRTTTEYRTLSYEVCDQPMMPGNCSQKALKWFYDVNTKYCRQFEFTGCNGNENRFETRQQCIEICESHKRREICNSNKIQGPCTQNLRRWFLDTETRSCKEFRYGGCLGNDNNFESRIECRNFCWEYLSEEERQNEYNQQKESSQASTTPATSQEDDDVCNLNRDEGSNCYNQTERWYFDSVLNTCHKFAYRGCNGNGNNFETKSKCEIRCLGSSSSSSSSVFDVSLSSTENLPCESSPEIAHSCLNDYLEILPYKASDSLTNKVWYYDVDSRSCKFIADECIDKTNPNRFSTFEGCKRQCIPFVTENPTQADCLLPLDTGHSNINIYFNSSASLAVNASALPNVNNFCNLHIWRWYYDMEVGHCYQFSYTGCLGNNNNFKTNRECLWLCASVGTQGCPSLSNCKETCKFGRVKSLSGCELCECINPCEKLNCPSNQQCVVENSIPVCRPKFKPGNCPEKQYVEDKSCNSTCSSDAECPYDKKCCMSSCSSFTCVIPHLDFEPVIDEFNEKADVFEGDTLILPCKVSGVPLPKVSWFKNRNELVASGVNDARVTVASNNSLIIVNVTDKDGAVYSCRATNVVGKVAVKESTVTILAPVRIHHGSYDKYELFGLDASMHCNATGRPSPKIQWRTERFLIRPNPLKYSIVGNVLIIKRFDSLDLGKYTCIASNNFGEANVTVTLKRAMPAEVTFGSYDALGKVNTSITLKCNHTGNPKPSIVWFTPKNQQIRDPLKPGFSTYKSHRSVPALSRFKVNENGDLEISNLTVEDAGLYQCTVSNQFSFGSSKKRQGTILLNLHSPPSILTKANTVLYVNHSSDVVLNCETSGKPKPQISWYKNDKLLVNDLKSFRVRKIPKYNFTSSNGSLSIFGVQEEDSANYYCVAKSADFPEVTLNYTVKVIKSLKNQTFTIEATENESVELDCKFNQEISTDQIVWTFNETSKLDASYKYKHELGSDRRKLVLLEVSIEQSGIYDCSGRLDEQDFLTRYQVSVKPKKLVEEYKHKVVKANETESSLVLDCTWWWLIDSFNNYLLDEKSLAVWTFNNDTVVTEGEASANGRTYEFLDNHNTLLKISGLSSSKDNGTNYTCSFKLSKQSILRISSFTLNFSVPAAPFPVQTSQIRSTIVNNTVKWYDKYDKVNLPCPFDGVPNPRRTWFFNSNLVTSNQNYEIDVNNDSLLRINELTEVYEGVYTCNASNEMSTQIMNYSVQIADPIYLNEPSRNSYYAKRYENIEITCHYTGGKPKPVITWQLNGTDLPLSEIRSKNAKGSNSGLGKLNKTVNSNGSKYLLDHNILIIKNVSKYDSGVYTCLLTNGYHLQQSLNFTLIVQEPILISFTPEAPQFSVGTEAKVTCGVADASYESRITQINWYRNGARLQNSDKYAVSRSGELVIKSLNKEDAGKYICRVYVGQTQTGKVVNIRVDDSSRPDTSESEAKKEEQTEVDCEDTSSHTDCKLVVSKGLCSKWGKYCCRTCTLAGQMKKKIKSES